MSPESSTNILVHAVRKVPVFRALSGDQIRKILGSCKNNSFEPGEQICRSGTPSEEMYILVAGELAVVTVEGLKVAKVLPVTTVGEMGLITGKSRSATVEASKPSKIFSISKARFERILREDLGMRVKVFRNIIDILSGKLTSDNMRLRDYQIEKRSSEDSIALLERQLETEEHRLEFAMELALSAGDISAAEIELHLDEKLQSMVQSVLVVDDEAEIRNLLKKVLSAYVVLEAENGYQALNIAQEETLNLVITDIRMSDMDGFELLDKIRSEFPDLPVLAISGYLDAEALKDCNFDGFIDKPISLGQLQTMVEKTLVQSRQ